MHDRPPFVDQTIMYDPDSDVMGNCWQACVATLLRRPLDRVPHFVQLHQSVAEVDHATRVFAKDCGYEMIEVGVAWLDGSRAPVMLHGKSPRGVSHVVIGEGLDIVHDPHPSRAGLTTISGGYLFAPMLWRPTRKDHADA